jgi:hypothetical protein
MVRGYTYDASYTYGAHCNYTCAECFGAETTVFVSAPAPDLFCFATFRIRYRQQLVPVIVNLLKYLMLFCENTELNNNYYLL